MLSFLAAIVRRMSKPKWIAALLDNGTITHQEIIAVSMKNVLLDFWKVESTEASHAETIAVSMKNLNIAFIHIDDI